MIDTTEIAEGIYRIAFWDEEDLAEMTFPGFSYNLFLVAAEQPSLIQTMYRRTYPRLREQVGKVLDPASLRYIVVPHHTGDSSGALNEWLATAPHATAVCSPLCSRLSLYDFADRTPQVVEDGEVLDLGSHRLRFLMTPHIDQWDSMMVYEEHTGTLFPNDLFSVPGVEVRTAQDVSEVALAVAQQAGYTPDDRAGLDRALDKIAALETRTLVPMHGPAITAHIEDLIRCFRHNALSAAPAA